MGVTVNDEPDFDPYAVLGVTRNADDDVIRAAWKTQVRKNHPDIVGPDGEAATARINAAYNMIRTPELRARYDRDHLAQQQPPITPNPQSEHVSNVYAAAQDQPSSYPEAVQDPRPTKRVWKIELNRGSVIRSLATVSAAAAVVAAVLFIVAWRLGGLSGAAALLGAIGVAVAVWRSLGWKRLASAAAVALSWYLYSVPGALCSLAAVAAAVGVWVWLAAVADMSRVSRVRKLAAGAAQAGAELLWVREVMVSDSRRLLLNVESLTGGAGGDVVVWADSRALPGAAIWLDSSATRIGGASRPGDIEALTRVSRLERLGNLLSRR
ncbi:J domain-containing protein [Pseudoclavibacter soli]|uniref:J domain-containing protein n=1 Tax=Pseudoclavibacter soli TaxID=452623 RepID=UPI0006883801|nr:J domain-containing protein [Pseudoclavibacter soli]